MERNIKIAYVNLKHNLLPHILVVIGMCLIAPLIMGTRNLDKYQVAKIIELYLSLAGIILLIPLFIPEMDKDIRELIYSKKQPIIINHVINTLVAITIMILIGMMFLAYLKKGNCEFNYITMLEVYAANAIFLGGLGILIYAITDHVIFAYMIPMIYYILNYGIKDKHLGKMYLFGMMKGNMEGKEYLLLWGIVFIIVGVIVRNLRYIKM